jgi:hypothetical protein
MRVIPQTATDPSLSDSTGGFTRDYLDGVEAIASYLGWSVRKVRYARETGALPIRSKPGVGLYAFKSELVKALKKPDTLLRKAEVTS